MSEARVARFVHEQAFLVARRRVCAKCLRVLTDERKGTNVSPAVAPPSSRRTILLSRSRHAKSVIDALSISLEPTIVIESGKTSFHAAQELVPPQPMDLIVPLAASLVIHVEFHSLDLFRTISAMTDDGSRKPLLPNPREQYTSNVAFQQLVPHLASWPTRIDKWLDVLPTPPPEERFVADAPRRGVSWRESRRYGWPPRRFVGRARTRVASHELIRGLRWTLEELLRTLRTGGLAVNDTVQFDTKLRDQMKAARAVLQLPLLVMFDAEAPSPQARRAMRDEGGPWIGVADVAAVLRQ